MAEFKGTKGKWYLKIVKDYGVNVFSKIKKGNKKICTLYSKWYGAEQTQQANALLISKAPEMLEMLTYLYANDLLKDNADEVLKLIKESTEL